MRARGKSRFGWVVSGAVSTLVTGFGGLVMASCSPQPLDVVNGCDVALSVYSGSNDSRAGTTARVDTLTPGATAETYVPDGSEGVIYVRIEGTTGWSGPLSVSPLQGADGGLAYVIQGDACSGVVPGIEASGEATSP